MDYKEGIQAKVEIVFRIANQFLAEQLELAEAKKQIDREMVNIRPAQYEAVKIELGKRLSDSSSPLKTEKFFDLFKNYLSLPFTRLETGHPLRNYYEENNRVRSYLLAIDEMEGGEAALEDWRNVYESIKEYQVHIERQVKDFYPLMLSLSMRLQIEKAKELGAEVVERIHKNEGLLAIENIVEFLINQRSFTQSMMDYMELEERVLFPKALSRLTNQEFKELRKLDDRFGYAFIDQPKDYVPKETKKGFESELVLSSLINSKYVGIIYYTLSGEPISTEGKQIREMDLAISEEIKEALLKGNSEAKKYYYKDENGAFLITYCLIFDAFGKPQGIVKTKEDIGEIQQKSINYF